MVVSGYDDLDGLFVEAYFKGGENPPQSLNFTLKTVNADNRRKSKTFDCGKGVLNALKVQQFERENPAVINMQSSHYLPQISIEVTSDSDPWLQQAIHLHVTANDTLSAFTSFPSSFLLLRQLTKLELVCHSFSSLPASINQLSELQTLVVRGCDLKSKKEKLLLTFDRDYSLFFFSFLVSPLFLAVPTEIGDLSKLQMIDFHENKLKELPKTLGNLRNLDTLILRKNDLTQFLSEWCGLANLKRLDISHNSISKLPVEFRQLIQLEVLLLSDNQFSNSTSALMKRLKSDPTEGLHFLERLSRLDISDNKICELPSFSRLQNLVDLNISNNSLSSLPMNLESASQLVRLDASNNSITEIPASIFAGLTNLQILNLQQNKLRLLPSELARMQALVHLNLSQNRMSVISSSFGQLKALQSLKLSFNSFIQANPATFEGLQQLRSLDMSHNQIVSLPDDFCLMETLVFCDLSFNQLLSLPQSWEKMKQLRTLILSSNNLRTIPESFSEMSSLKQLMLAQNLGLKALPLSFFQFSLTQFSVGSFAIDLENGCVDLIDRFGGDEAKAFQGSIYFPSDPFQMIEESVFFSSLSHVLSATEPQNQQSIHSSSSTTTTTVNSSPLPSPSPSPVAISSSKQPPPDLDLLFSLCETSPSIPIAFALRCFSLQTDLKSCYESQLDKIFNLLSFSHSPGVQLEALHCIQNLTYHSTLRPALSTHQGLVNYLISNIFPQENATDEQPTEQISIGCLEVFCCLCLDTSMRTQLLKQSPLQSFVQLARKETASSKTKRMILKLLSICGVVSHLNNRISDLPENRGLRILCMDGGGTKSVGTIEIVRAIENRTGKRIFEMFDLICGTSVGGILACCFGILHMSATEVETLLRDLCRDIFNVSGSSSAPVSSSSSSTTVYIGDSSSSSDTSSPTVSSIIGEKLTMLQNVLSSGGIYDTRRLEAILQQHFGNGLMIDSSENISTPKVFTVAAAMNYFPPTPYLFRNYCLPEGVCSRYRGTSERRVWESARATSAAPSMFSECVYEDDRFTDGALLANNPSGMAFHEMKMLWGGNCEIDCFLSLGTGRPLIKKQKKGIKDFVKSVIESATDVTLVSDMLEDFLSPEIYFRLNPTGDSFDVLLDETRTEKLDAIKAAASQYADEQFQLLNRLGRVLSPAKAIDFFPPAPAYPAPPAQTTVQENDISARLDPPAIPPRPPKNGGGYN